jgi:HEAT repeat protein
MGFFRRSGSTLEQCIEKHEYQGVVLFYLKGVGEDAAAAIGALLIFGEYDPQAVADVLGSLNNRDMMDVVRAIVQSGGPDHPAVLALGRYAGDELGRSLGRAVMRCGEDAFDALVNITGAEDQNARLGAICLLGFIGKSGIPVLKEIVYRSEGEEQRTAARCLQRLEWMPEKPEEKPMFFFLCDDWEELVRLKERAFPLLFSLVKKDDPTLRKHAIQAMGEIGDGRVVSVIIPYVDDCDPKVRIAAVMALVRYDTPETEQLLVSALGHLDSQIRIDAAHALKRKGWTPRTQGEQIRYTIASGNWDAVIRLGDRVIPDLIRIVRSGDNEWMGAVYALAGLGPDVAQELQTILPSLPELQQKDIVSVFRKATGKHRLKRENLQKEHELELKKQEEEKKKISGEDDSKGPSDSEIFETQKRVIEGFKWLRLQKVATEQIYAIISEGVEVHNISFEMAVAALSSKDEAIRAAAIDVLSMKGERAYPYIMKAAYDKSQIVRTAVADGVGFIGQTSMMKVLSFLSKDPSVDVRLAVVRALQVMNDERAFPYIVNLFSDENLMVRDSAAHAAATYGPFGLPVLIRSLQVKDSEIRIAAAAALGEICDIRSLAYLLPHLGEPDRRVRDAIRAAIVQHDYRAIEPLQEFIKEAEGDAKNAAALALYEIDPDLAGESGADSRIFEETPGAAETVGAITGSPARSFFSRKKTSVSGRGEVKPADTEFASPPQTADEMSDVSGLHMDSRTCEELVLRIEGGEESLSSALLVDLYDEKSSLKTDLISGMKGSDREFAMHAATLLSTIGWSPDGSVEETLFLLATGKIADLKKGGDSVARVLSGMVNAMPPSVQNMIVDVLSCIGGREGINGLVQIISGDSGAISGLAAESLADMDEDAVPFIREAAASEEGAGKRRLLKIVREIEGGR